MSASAMEMEQNVFEENVKGPQSEDNNNVELKHIIPSIHIESNQHTHEGVGRENVCKTTQFGPILSTSGPKGIDETFQKNSDNEENNVNKPLIIQDDRCKEAMDILKLLTMGRPRSIVNILLLGLQGVGKSSLVNSCIAALNPDGHHQVAQQGDHGIGGHKGSAQITSQLRRYRVMDQIMHETSSQDMCKPIFWDCPGLKDEYDEIKINGLHQLLDGYVPAGEDFKDFKKFAKFKKKIKSDFSPDGKIHIVCFVHSGENQDVPSHLLRAVKAAILRTKREVPVILVITKIDKVDKIENNYRASEDYQEWIRKLQAPLGLIDVDDMLIQLSCYCKDVTPIVYKPGKRNAFGRSHKVDRDICKLWDTLLDPAYINREDYNVKKEKTPFRFFRKS